MKSTKRGLTAAVVAVSLAMSGCYVSCGDIEEVEPDAGTPIDPADCWSPPSESSKPVPDSQVSLWGSVGRADGTPLSGQVLFEDPTTLGDIFWTISTLGMLCLIDDVSAGASYCDHFEKLPLDSTGRYSFQIAEEATRGWLLVEYAKTFGVHAAAPKEQGQLVAPSASLWFKLETQQVELPAVRLWEPRLEVSESNGTVQVSYPSPGPLACTEMREVRITFLDRELEGVWSQPAGPVDARLLEDVDGIFVAKAYYWNQSDGPVESLEVSSPGVAYTSRAGAPPSRGAACTIAEQSHAPGECPLTDGKLAGVQVAGGPITLDLGAARPLEMVVLRGSVTAVYLEASLDGQQWSLLETLDGGLPVARPPAGTSARYLRLRARPQTEQEYGGGFGSLSEVSVW